MSFGLEWVYNSIRFEFCSLGILQCIDRNGRISKEMGLPSCIKMAPMPFPNTSHSTIKVFVKSGVVKTIVLHITSFQKLGPTYGVQENVSFFNNVIRGGSSLP